jgi:hypothetical protein
MHGIQTSSRSSNKLFCIDINGHKKHQQLCVLVLTIWTFTTAWCCIMSIEQVYRPYDHYRDSVVCYAQSVSLWTIHACMGEVLRLCRGILARPSAQSMWTHVASVWSFKVEHTCLWWSSFVLAYHPCDPPDRVHGFRAPNHMSLVLGLLLANRLDVLLDHPRVLNRSI